MLSDSRIRFATLSVLSGLLLFGGAPALQAEDPLIISFDIPGGERPTIVAINNKGDVVGTYTDPELKTLRVFLRHKSGSFTLFDVPVAAPTSGTNVSGINDEGEIVGNPIYNPTGPETHALAYIRSPEGKITLFGVPGATDTYANAINNAGEIAGSYIDAIDFTTRGFTRNKQGEFVTFSKPGEQRTYPTGLNAYGAVAASCEDNDGNSYGLLVKPSGRVTNIFAPKALDTNTAGIDDAGDVVGQFYERTANSLLFHGFIRNANTLFTTFDVPGALNTYVTTGNATGEILGIYDIVPYGEPSWAEYSYTRDPSGKFTMIRLPGATETVARAINAGGDLAGAYADRSKTVHGFIWLAQAGIRGDLNGDGRVDNFDLNIILAGLNTTAKQPVDPRDLNRDGLINALDARILVSLCTTAGCSTH